MEGISSYRGNRPTPQTKPQADTYKQTGAITIHYPLSLPRSVTRNPVSAKYIGEGKCEFLDENRR